jgi:hypothetical protein
MLNKGILALNVPLCGGRRFMLTKTLEWNFRWGVLDHMMDDTTFTIRTEFLSHPEHLATRFRCGALSDQTGFLGICLYPCLHNVAFIRLETKGTQPARARFPHEGLIYEDEIS